MKERPRVVILGGGIGGIKAAQQLANQPVDVLIIDHNNYQVFQPLLYQVATSMLSTDEVVYPIRGFFKKANNVDFLLAEVRGIQPEAKIVKTSHGDVPYDYLIIALGSTPNFFGNKEVERNAFPLKTLQDAIRIRSHLLSVFEEASAETDPEKRKALLTFVFVGAGPIGVEGAGGVSELVYDVLQKEFHHIDFEEVSIHLIGADPCVLSMMSEKLRIETLKVLQKKRIDVQCSMLVTGYDGETLSYRPMNAPKDAPCSTLKAKTVVWSAGVRPVDCLIALPAKKTAASACSSMIRFAFRAHRISLLSGTAQATRLPVNSVLCRRLRLLHWLKESSPPRTSCTMYAEKRWNISITRAKASWPSSATVKPSWKQALCAAVVFSPGRPGSGFICSRKRGSMPISPSRLNGFSIIFSGHALAA